MPNVCVVGAGIVGLTTATILQEREPSYQITVMADKFNKDTVSDVAAGLFRPGYGLTGPSPEVTRKWFRDAWHYYRNVANGSDAVNEGVKDMSGYHLASKDPKLVRNNHLKEFCPDYRAATESELNSFPGTWRYGYFYTTLLIEPGRRLPYLLDKFSSRGGKVVKRKLESFKELVNEGYDVVFNCTGLGSRDLLDDFKLNPMRGQVFKVYAPWIKTFHYFDTDTYIIPGFKYTTVGGCRQYESWNEEVCKYDASAIWERATDVMPSLKNAEIVQQRVGLRPQRSVVRVETEVMNFGGKKLRVIHNYGHGGYGILSSPGTSIHAIELIQDFLQTQSKL